MEKKMKRKRHKASLLAMVLMLSVILPLSMPVSASTQLLDYFDIGNTISEAGHNLQGWGPIEPATHGGNWGNISNPPEDGTCRVTWESNPTPANESNRSASFTMTNHGLNATELELKVLDGHANDSFTVYINSNLAYSYICDPSTIEYWVTHIIDVSGYQNQDPLPVTINATGPAWGSHSTYGLLGVSWVKLSTEEVPQNLPDLVITKAWVNWTENVGCNCSIWYNLTNIGNGTAPKCHNTTLYVDGVEKTHDPVNVTLAPNGSYISCFKIYTWNYTPPSDDIAICADYNNTVEETDESNWYVDWLSGTTNTTWRCGDVNNDQTVDMIDVLDTYDLYAYNNRQLHEWAADANKDTTIDMIDVLDIFDKYAYGRNLNCWC